MLIRPRDGTLIALTLLRKAASMSPECQLESERAPSAKESAPLKTRRRAARGGRKPAASAVLEEERELVERLRRAEPEALTELYAAHRACVYRYVRSRVSNEAEAEDLTQDTFVQAIRSVARFEQRSSLRCWLLGIARHVCLHFYRFGSRWMIGAGSSPSVVEPIFDARIESRLDAKRLLDRCDVALAAHRGPESLEIFHQRYADGSPIGHIAADLGKSRDAIKANLRRSRQAIARVLPQHEDLIA